MSFLLEIINQGLLYSVLAIGVMISYKILDFADLSVDGTVPLGGAVCAVLLTQFNQPVVALIGGFLAGGLAGILTGLLHVKLKMSGLLSGILVMSGLYSVNLIIAGNTSNIPVFNYQTIFSLGNMLNGHVDKQLLPLLKTLINSGILIVIVMAIKFSLDWFLTTKLGFLIKITGDNPQLVTSLGQSLGRTKIIALALSNALVGLFGALFVQLGGTYNLTVGSGMVVIGLASVIIGTTLFKRLKGMKMTTMVILGAILYRAAIALAFKMNVPTYYEKLLTVILFILTIALNNQSLFGGRKNDRHQSSKENI